jgi:hypothetical protein
MYDIHVFFFFSYPRVKVFSKRFSSLDIAQVFFLSSCFSFFPSVIGFLLARSSIYSFRLEEKISCGRTCRAQNTFGPAYVYLKQILISLNECYTNNEIDLTELLDGLSLVLSKQKK